CEGLVEAGRRLAERHTVAGLHPSLPAVGDGFVPHLTPQGMLGQTLDLVRALPAGRKALRPRSLLCHTVPSERLEHLDKTRMPPWPPLLEEATVGHLMREGVFESVVRLGEQAYCIQELRRLEVCQAAVQSLLGHVRNGAQQGEGHVRPDHGCSLEQAFLLW